MSFLLWILGIIMVVFGVVNVLNGAVLWGVVLIVIGCIVGGFGFGPRAP